MLCFCKSKVIPGNCVIGINCLWVAQGNMYMFFFYSSVLLNNFSFHGLLGIKLINYSQKHFPIFYGFLYFVSRIFRAKLNNTFVKI